MKAKLLIIFFVLNFLALGIGGKFTGVGVPSEWYQTLNKAPWTPPGWVFGLAWTVIMLCFSVYMANLYQLADNKKVVVFLYVLQWVLNVGWNPLFFKFHAVLVALLVIASLTILVGYFLFSFRSLLRYKALWVAPYFVWLLIATSLNAYVYFYN
jgi:translocator protein